MEVKGIIENGKLIKELVEYECEKCGNNVCLEFNHAMEEKTYHLFSELIADRHCLSCNTDSKIPVLVECLVH